MALLDTPERRGPSAANGANLIRQMMRQTVSHMELSLRQVRQIMERHGREAVIAELGSDAQELQAIYAKLRETIKSLDSSREIPDLPE